MDPFPGSSSAPNKLGKRRNEQKETVVQHFVKEADGVEAGYRLPPNDEDTCHLATLTLLCDGKWHELYLPPKALIGRKRNATAERDHPENVKLAEQMQPRHNARLSFLPDATSPHGERTTT